LDVPILFQPANPSYRGSERQAYALGEIASAQSSIGGQFTQDLEVELIKFAHVGSNAHEIAKMIGGMYQKLGFH
jgi:hypothetical protein